MATSVAEMAGRTRVDRESGSLVVYRQFAVQRPGHDAHTVEVEVSGDSGTPQAERCDCRGYAYRRECAHITAVYEAGVLGCDWGN
jgi:hypothetical protein